MCSWGPAPGRSAGPGRGTRTCMCICLHILRQARAGGEALLATLDTRMHNNNTTSPSARHSAVRPCLCSAIMLYGVDRKTYPKMLAYMYCVGVTGRRERIPCKPCRRTESSDDEDEGKDNDGASGQDRQGNSGCDAAGSAAKVGLSLSTKSSLGPSSLLPSRRPLCVHYPLLSTSIILLSTSTPNLLSLPHSSFSLRTPALYNAGNHPGQPQASKQIQVRSPKGW